MMLQCARASCFIQLVTVSKRNKSLLSKAVLANYSCNCVASQLKSILLCHSSINIVPFCLGWNPHPWFCETGYSQKFSTGQGGRSAGLTCSEPGLLTSVQKFSNTLRCRLAASEVAGDWADQPTII